MSERERLPNRRPSRFDPQAIDATLRLLSEHWPKCFFLYEQRRKPLALLIDQQIAAALGDIITSDDLTAALGFYTHNDFYLRACVAGAVRVGLAGEPAGVVSEKEAAYAAKIIARRQAKAKAVTHGGDRKNDQDYSVILKTQKSDQRYSLFLKTQKEVAEQAEKPAPPKRVSLADLKRAAQQRRMAAVS